ncbi:MAG: hypothetical protein GXP19_09635 [Gammaproteobacteria bacterium]|nr:hypothetical protein [Gammaproteobacteria bacterium]
MALKFFSRFLLANLFLLITFPQVALSEHEADHRYTIQGYVLDNQQQGIGNSNVKVFLDEKLIAQKTTDNTGFYKAQLHLHDPDFGKELEIVTDKGKGNVKIEFKLGDKETERFHNVNFIDGQITEGELPASGFAQWIYFAIGGVVILIIVIVMGGKAKGKNKSKQKKKKK